MACDPNSPRASPLFRRLCDHLRWLPLVFVLSLLVYAYITLTLSLAIGYTILRTHSLVKALFQLLISTLLAGGAAWSFLVAVFRHPGSPSSNHVAASSSAQELAHAGTRPTHSASQQHGRDTRGDDHDDDNGDDHDEHSGLLAADDHDHDDAAASAPLLSAPLPGQPQLPARSGRQQLSDHLRLASSHHDLLPSSSSSAASNTDTTNIRAASDIWVKSSGESRWCAKCNAPKPDRCHHCSSPFFLFLCYTALLCIYATQESARALVAYVGNEVDGYESSPITWAVLLFMGFIFGCTLAPFAGYHAYLILKNRTTLEAMEGSGRRAAAAGGAAKRATPPPTEADRGSTSTSADPVWRSDEHLTREERRALKKANRLNVYDVGLRRNWRQVMGNDPWLWPVPIGEPVPDGYTYLVNLDTLTELERLTASIRSKDARPPPPHAPPSSSSAHHHRGDGNRAGGEPDEGPGYDWRRPGQRTRGAHGEMEWGDAPRKSPWGVLYGVDDSDDDDQGPIGSGANAGRGQRQHVLSNESEGDSADDDDDGEGEGAGGRRWRRN
ncbi:uncharacterized protein PFL1_02395 [Pseudozyma flocculosa PF-1]|uniref:uncharacterized protein n=1 Tax=Pseudozyma flocculosa PF-1 TaxID=1277687 RepID=UPI0004560EBA|nr:uncharacterized protein PFL1_02395 [Pseudozyma flocculosa PF-1]EPQ30279.1 hypothetical protein PFL1_02395 [Pseudozyma flocculosa PF-1]